MPRKHIHLADRPQLAGLSEAIALCGGSRRELARRVARDVPKFSPQRIDNWYAANGVVPLAVAPYIAKAVGGKVTVFDLRPDYEDGWHLLREQLRAAPPKPQQQKVVAEESV
jgi:DNA-binding transcriptional regulator YdaS (Cro superfamily)